MNLLRAEQVSLAKAGRTILQPLDFKLDAGELVGIIGPNGAGKSSLLRVLAGLEPAACGKVFCEGEDLDRLAPRQRARRLGYHAQTGEIHWPLRVDTVVALGRLPHAGSLAALGAADHAAIAAALRQTKLSELRERRCDSLSGGELARVHIARLLAGAHRTVLADEPIANLDPRFQVEILSLLCAHTLAGGAAVVVLHDLNIAARYCDLLVLLEDGHIAAQGAPSVVLTAAYIERVFGMPASYLIDTGIDRALKDPPACRAMPGP